MLLLHLIYEIVWNVLESPDRLALQYLVQYSNRFENRRKYVVDPRAFPVQLLVRDVQVLADRGDEGFTTLAVESLGHVENDVGASEHDVLRKELVGFEADYIAEETERLRHRSDGGWPMRRRVASKGVPGEHCTGPVTDSDLAAGRSACSTPRHIKNRYTHR